MPMQSRKRQRLAEATEDAALMSSTLTGRYRNAFAQKNYFILFEQWSKNLLLLWKNDSGAKTCFLSSPDFGADDTELVKLTGSPPFIKGISQVARKTEWIS